MKPQRVIADKLDNTIEEIDINDYREAIQLGSVRKFYEKTYKASYYPKLSLLVYTERGFSL